MHARGEKAIIIKPSPCAYQNLCPHQKKNVDFMVLEWTMATDSKCVYNAINLCENVGSGIWSTSYTTKYFGGFGVLNPGFRVLWSDLRVLATDYNT